MAGPAQVFVLTILIDMDFLGVDVVDDNANRCAAGNAVLSKTGKDMALVSLFSG